MTVDHCLVRVAFAPLEDEHAEVHNRDKDENNALTPVHGRVSYEIDPDSNRVCEARQYIEDHHSQDTDSHLAKHDSLDPLAARFC